MRLRVIELRRREWELSWALTEDLAAMAAREVIQLGLMVTRGLLVPPPR